jgi:ketosteroid isomerase-like protein
VRIAALSPALLLVLVLGFSVQIVRAASKESETIVRLEKEWITAFMKGDRPTVDRMETPTYTAADDEEGQETKAQQLKSMDERQKPDLGESFTPEKQDVRLFGNVALLTGLYDVKEGPDKPQERMQVTEVWVKQGGTWKVEHIQYAILKPPK